MRLLAAALVAAAVLGVACGKYGPPVRSSQVQETQPAEPPAPDAPGDADEASP